MAKMSLEYTAMRDYFECHIIILYVHYMYIEKYIRKGGGMMRSSNGNIFRVTGHLCEELTRPRWIPHTKASDAELWCFLWSASE